MWKLRNAARYKHIMYTLKYPEIAIAAVRAGKNVKYCALTKSKANTALWPFSTLVYFS